MPQITSPIGVLWTSKISACTHIQKYLRLLYWSLLTRHKNHRNHLLQVSRPVDHSSLPSSWSIATLNTELIVSYRNHLGFRSPEGTQFKMGYSYVPPLKTPLSRPPDRSLKPQSQIFFFKFLKTLHSPEITNFWKYAFQSLRMEEKLSSYA